MALVELDVGVHLPGRGRLRLHVALCNAARRSAPDLFAQFGSVRCGLRHGVRFFRRALHASDDGLARDDRGVVRSVLRGADLAGTGRVCVLFVTATWLTRPRKCFTS